MALVTVWSLPSDNVVEEAHIGLRRRNLRRWRGSCTLTSCGLLLKRFVRLITHWFRSFLVFGDARLTHSTIFRMWRVSRLTGSLSLTIV
jgi:hypothetical protein